MQVRDFRDSDLKQLNHWLGKHKQAAIAQDAIPVLSFIVPGIAIASIRLVEGNVGLVDNMVTNPYASCNARHRALEALYSHIKLKTEQLELKRLYGLSSDAGALSRAIRQGFKPVQLACLVYAKDNQ